MAKRDRLDVTEAVLKGLLKQVGPKEFVIALNNVCAHGKVFRKAGLRLDNDDALLGEWFEGIETLNTAATKIEDFQKV